MDAEQLKALRHIASVCIAPAPELIPAGEERARLVRSVEQLEAMSARLELTELQVGLLGDQIQGLRHRLDTGCRCREAAAAVLAHELHAAGAMPKLPDRAS